jgi:pseudouridine synthase
MRLHKYLALCGVASRRAAETLVAAGRVTVNGNVVSNVRRGVHPEAQDIRVDGKRVEPEEKVYIMLNKPAGYLTTMSDPHGRRTVSELVAEIPQRVFPVGRLDMDTHGLLLMTNDGEVTYHLTHPKFEISKTYHAVVEGIISEKALDKLRSGVQLSDGVTSPAQVCILSQHGNESNIEIIIAEGRKRQVRRMCTEVGHEVVELQRVAMAELALGDLPAGTWRYLSPEEISQLRQLVDRAE